LTHAEEQALAKWITHLMATGHPARHCFIKEIAEEIRRERHAHSAIPVSYPDLGNAWVPQFLSRHPSLQTTLARAIESARIKDVSSEAILNFFAIFSALLEEHQIPHENVYNMDETGIPLCYFINKRICDWRKSNQLCCCRFHPSLEAQPGRQEWVTVIECICANGSSIPPMIIFKGKSLMTSWIPQTAPNDWYYAYNTKGWTNNEHGITWLKLSATALKANGKKRLLICDGHDSHISPLSLSVTASITIF
jgi:DDE superfamily endonuclease/Tc5 transposase DNA-binding domain